jgi:hypothetical protein
MPEPDHQLFSVLKHPNGTCSVLALEDGTDAAGVKLSFWVEVASVSQGYAFAQQIVDRMNNPPARTRAKTS